MCWLCWVALWQCLLAVMVDLDVMPMRSIVLLAESWELFQGGLDCNTMLVSQVSYVHGVFVLEVLVMDMVV